MTVKKCQISTGKNAQFLSNGLCQEFSVRNQTKAVFWAPIVLLNGMSSRMIIWDGDTYQYHTLRLGAWPKLCVEMLVTLRKTLMLKLFGKNYDPWAFFHD